MLDDLLYYTLQLYCEADLSRIRRRKPQIASSFFMVRCYDLIEVSPYK